MLTGFKGRMAPNLMEKLRKKEKMVTELVMVDLACMKNKTNVEPEQN